MWGGSPGDSGVIFTQADGTNQVLRCDDPQFVEYDCLKSSDLILLKQKWSCPK